MTEYHSAVIFDVDGPLLDLTPAESAAFFTPFYEEFGLNGLSEDWNSYAIRNDVEIYREVLTAELGRPADDETVHRLGARYCEMLVAMYDRGGDAVSPIPGALELLEALAEVSGMALGTATANFEGAARVRLERAGMFDFIQHYHSGAEGGGAKRMVLKRTIDRLGLPPERIVFLGDNLNDLEAAQANGTHFIGFHTDPERQTRLAEAGAAVTAGDHGESLTLIHQMLDL